MIENDQHLKQIERLISSRVLHGSESLCKLLQYLAKHTLDHPNAPANISWQPKYLGGAVTSTRTRIRPSAYKLGAFA
jgi:hypothetical protein